MYNVYNLYYFRDKYNKFIQYFFLTMILNDMILKKTKYKQFS